MSKITKARGNKNIRIIILLILIAVAAGMWWYGDKTDNETLKIRRVVVGGVSAIATGLEFTEKDYDLEKLW